MDARTANLLQSLQGYLEHPPPGVPEQLISEMNNMHEMLSAPRYSEESPGEQSAREAAQKTMPSDVYERMYGDDSESSDSDVGVFGQVQAGLLGSQKRAREN